MGEPIDPVSGVPKKVTMRTSAGGGSPGVERTRQHVVGQVVAIHEKATHRDGEHVLDATVGAEGHTEIVVRILSGPYRSLDGKRVVLTLSS